MAVVLIVEDEEQVRVLAEAIIQDLGHETLTAGTAEQALGHHAGPSRCQFIVY
jgi:CheY-like chemotaxis protein